MDNRWLIDSEGRVTELGSSSTVSASSWKSTSRSTSHQVIRGDRSIARGQFYRNWRSSPRSMVFFALKLIDELCTYERYTLEPSYTINTVRQSKWSPQWLIAAVTIVHQPTVQQRLAWCICTRTCRWALVSATWSLWAHSFFRTGSDHFFFKTTFLEWTGLQGRLFDDE